MAGWILRLALLVGTDLILFAIGVALTAGLDWIAHTLLTNLSRAAVLVFLALHALLFHTELTCFAVFCLLARALWGALFLSTDLSGRASTICRTVGTVFVGVACAISTLVRGRYTLRLNASLPGGTRIR